jgi:hypothetical protein
MSNCLIFLSEIGNAFTLLKKLSKLKDKKFYKVFYRIAFRLGGNKFKMKINVESS